MRDLLHRILAWLLAALDDSACPYRCERHRDSWMRRVPPRGW